MDFSGRGTTSAPRASAGDSEPQKSSLREFLGTSDYPRAPRLKLRIADSIAVEPNRASIRDNSYPWSLRDREGCTALAAAPNITRPDAKALQTFDVSSAVHCQNYTAIKYGRETGTGGP